MKRVSKRRGKGEPRSGVGGNDEPVREYGGGGGSDVSSATLTVDGTVLVTGAGLRIVAVLALRILGEVDEAVVVP